MDIIAAGYSLISLVISPVIMDQVQIRCLSKLATFMTLLLHLKTCFLF
jgi:hypothetical protein